jgi:hypothetical protein
MQAGRLKHRLRGSPGPGPLAGSKATGRASHVAGQTESMVYGAGRTESMSSMSSTAGQRRVARRAASATRCSPVWPCRNVRLFSAKKGMAAVTRVKGIATA